MSRIGKKPITIPAKVTITLNQDEIVVKGEKGQLSLKIPEPIGAKLKKDQLIISANNESKKTKSLFGLTRSLINNMVIGVNKGYQKELELVGTGYRVTKDGDDLSMTLGFSHPIKVKSKPTINLDLQGNNKIIISGIDKQAVGQMAAEIRSLRKPEPYKGKGIRYSGEIVKRKPGKAAKVGAGE